MPRKGSYRRNVGTSTTQVGAWPLPCERSTAPTRTYGAPRIAPQQARSTTLPNRGSVVLRVASRSVIPGRLLARPWPLATVLARRCLTQHAQQVLDAWVADYNFRRPHQALAMGVPAQRFQPAATASLSTVQPSQPAAIGPIEVTRRVSASGLIGVCYQQVSAGRHLAGQVVTVRLQPTILQVFFAGQLIRTVPRHSTKEVVQVRAHRPHRPRRRPTTT
jgi:hypothetical protein